MQPQNNFGKIRSNWFSRTIEKEGPDFMQTGKVSTEKIDANADRIIDDLIYGNIDFAIYGQYVIDSVIIGQLIKFCTIKIMRANSIKYALDYTLNDYKNGYIYVMAPSASARIPINTRAVTDMLTINAIANELEYANDDIVKYSRVKYALEMTEYTQNPYELGNLAVDPVLKTIAKKRKY